MKLIKNSSLLAFAIFFLSACGGPIENDSTVVDTTAPTFIGGDPQGNVIQASSVTAEFNEPLLASTITELSFVIQDDSTSTPLSTADGAWTLSPSSDTIALFIPAINLIGSYTVTVTTAITNTAGINLEADHTWNFTVVDTTAPTFIGGDPEGDVIQACSVSAEFNEPLLASTITELSFVIQDDSTSTPLSTADGAWTLSPSSDTIALFIPSSNPLFGSFTVTVTTAITNTAGINLAADHTWNFTTTLPCAP